MQKLNRNVTILLIFVSFISSSLFAVNTVAIPETEPEMVSSIPLDTPLEGTNDIFLEEEMLPSYKDPDIIWEPIEESISLVKESSESGIDNTITAAFDPLTETESIFDNSLEMEQELALETSFIEGYEGLFSLDGEPEAVIPPDGRTRITPTTSFPWNTICKLYITAADNSHWVGSGAVIDGFHVLTAGHCVFLHDNGGWASSIEVVPAKDTGVADNDPYGHAYMTYMRSYTGWTVSEMVEHDWAVITLDRNVGIYTGWMGRTTASSSSSIYTDTMNIAGYPTDLDGGVNMYYDSDSGDGATEYNHFYWADTAGGQSGGPVWRYISGNRYIMTVHAYGRAGTDSNYGTRLNSDKYNKIFDWLGADTAPTNRPDMKDRGSAYHWRNVNTVTAGSTSFSVQSDVRNIGTASTGGFYVHYYASTNDYISTADYLIGSVYVSSIAAYGSANADWTGTFPGTVPAGSYYVGWLIDRDNTVTEIDEGNNKGIQSTKITVIAPPPPSGYIEVRAYDSDTSNPLQSALVECWDGTDTLIDAGYTDSTGFYNITGLDIGWFTVNVSKSGYYEQSKQNYINWEGDDDYLYFYVVPLPPNSGYIDVTVKDSVSLLPLSSAYVQTYNMTTGTVINSGYTDGTGFYKITGLSIGWYEVHISRVGYENQVKQDYINWNGDDDYLTFNLVQKPPDSGYIEVRVFNETGGPVSSAYVECINQSSGLTIDTGYTNVDGFYNVTGLTIGWYTINVSKVGFYEQSKQNYINWNGDDDYLTYYLAALPPDSGFIEVYAYDYDTYAPLSGALVECFYNNGTLFNYGYTDAAGFYTITGLTVGWWQVNVSKPGYQKASMMDYINWAGDDDYLFFYLVPNPPNSGYIDVKVYDSDTSLPLGGANVYCFYNNGTLFSSGTTDSSGFFRITGLAIGWWDVEVQIVAYEGKKVSDYINWNGDDDYLYFYLKPLPPDSGYIEVNVFDSLFSQPINNAYVRCYNQTSGELFKTGYTDDAGFFNVTGLTVGWWDIKVSHPLFDEQTQSEYINWAGDDDYLYFYLDSNFVPIGGPYAIFQDNYPWNNYNFSEPILNDYGISYTVFDSSQFGVVDLSLYKKVYITADQSQTFYDRLAGNVTWFENYVNNGGILLISACDGGWHGGLWNNSYLLPGSVNKSSTAYTQNVTINLPSHPVLFNPYFVEDPELDNWMYSAHSHFLTYPLDSKEILLDGVSLKPVLLELKFGSGYIIMSTQPLEWNHNLNYTKLLVNLLLYDPSQYDDSITVTSPNNSNLWETYSDYHITWTTTGVIDNVKIELYRNDIYVMDIVESTLNDGDFLWNIPAGLVDSTQYQIKIYDAGNPSTYDFSEYFEILTPTIQVIKPDGSSAWNLGTTYSINWTTTGTIANVKLELYLNNTFVLTIASSTPNDGHYSWLVLGTLGSSDLYQIKVSDVSKSAIYDYSENFRITSPFEPSAIPGYDLYILLICFTAISLLVLKKRLKFKH